MIIIDSHCDTITKIMEMETDLNSNLCHVDISRMQEAGNYIQFFAAFISPSHAISPLNRAMQIFDKFFEQLDTYSDTIMLCCNYDDVETSLKMNKVGAILSVEGGDALQGDLSVLRMFYRIGVRSICLTWNHRNEIADGVCDSITSGGLTPFGRELIKGMNDLGMIIDLSHISEKGFYDAIEVSQSPVIVSHSNSRKICDHIRNLTDEQILSVKQNGGVIGLNFYPSFLNNSKNASMKDILNHIEHIIALTGPDHLGIGADFDGIENTPSDINGVEDIGKIFNELLKLNYSQEVVSKIAGVNYLKIIRDVLK